MSHRERSGRRSDPTLGEVADSEWAAFIASSRRRTRICAGTPRRIQSAVAHTDDVSNCGAFGGVESGWDKVASRLDWATSQFPDGTRNREEIRCAVGADFAYLVQTEQIRFRFRPDGRIDSQPAGDDGVSPRDGRMANRSSTG